MGYMTPFMLLNDGAHLLDDEENQKQFCEDISSATRNLHSKQLTISIGNYCNPVTALKPQHADVSCILYCGQNSFFDIYDQAEDLHIESNLSFYEKVAKESIEQGKALLKKVKDLKKDKIVFEGRL